MLTNQDFLTAKVALAISGTYEVTGTSPELTVKVSRNVATDLPPIVRKFVGEQLIVEETQVWKKITDSKYLAEFNLVVPNAPVQIKGQIELTGDSQTTVSITAIVKVNIPIFGAAAEPQVVNEIKKVLADEENLCRSWITK